MRRAVVLCAGGLALVFVLAGCNVGAFQMREAALQRTWQAWQAQGVPAASLAPARDRLAQIQARSAGPIPYSVISVSLVRDPLQAAAQMGQRAHDQALNAARSRALAALRALQAVGGPNYERTLENHVLALDRAQTPAALDRLTASWQQEATVLQQVQQQLAAAAGGMSGGLPADVVQNTVQLHGLVGSLMDLSLPIGSGGTAVVDAQMYLTLPYAMMLTEHPAVMKELQGATAELQGRMDMWDGARQTLSEAQGMLPVLESLGAAKDFQSRLTQAGAGLAAAHDDNALTQVSQSLDKLLADMQAAKAGAQAASAQQASTQTTPCLQGVPANLIIVHLATQQLVAYTNGCPWLQTPVTTGQPALPTDRGTFQIYAKYDSYQMISPWPQGSPYYYPPTMVNWAMEFVNDGTFIHSASWEPDSAYGAGSEDGPYASHGCVHVMAGPLQQLYNWAPIGTTVEVTD